MTKTTITLDEALRRGRTERSQAFHGFLAAIARRLTGRHAPVGEAA